MKVPTALMYTESHEWVEKTGETSAKLGLSDYAQDQLGDLVFVNLPEVGDGVDAGESFADVESVKAVSDIYSPVTGTVKAVNDAVLDSPECINKDPYEAWFIEVEDITDWSKLMDAAAYEEFCSNL